MYLRMDIRLVLTTCNVPDRDRVVIGTSYVELLVFEGSNSRSKNSTFMCLPSVDAVIFLTECGRVLVFTILHSAVFL